MLGLKENRPEARQIQFQISNLALPICVSFGKLFTFSSSCLEGGNEVHGVGI